MTGAAAMPLSDGLLLKFNLLAPICGGVPPEGPTPIQGAKIHI